MMHPLEVEISHLTKRFGERLVLNDVSLRIEAGQTIALIGPSGARQIDVVALDQRIEQL